MPNLLRYFDLYTLDNFNKQVFFFFKFEFYILSIISRFISLYFPTYYNQIFTDLVTTIFIVSIVVVSVVFSFVLVHGKFKIYILWQSYNLTLVDCVMGFSRARWMLDYVTPPCNMTNVYLSEFLRSFFLNLTNRHISNLGV